MTTNEGSLWGGRFADEAEVRRQLRGHRELAGVVVAAGVAHVVVAWRRGGRGRLGVGGSLGV